MPDPSKICAVCRHIRLTLGVVTSLEFRERLNDVLQRLAYQSDKTSEVTIDNNLVEMLAFLNWLSKQKFYCRNEHSWTRLFDVACYAWQPRDRIHAHRDPSPNPVP